MADPIDAASPRAGSEAPDATVLLGRLRAGEAGAASALLNLLYGELRLLAGSFFTRQRPGHTLQPTALVNEAYLRLIKGESAFESRGHFMAVAATAMRQVLTDHARRVRADKRGGGLDHVTLDNLEIGAGGNAVDLIALDAALTKLTALNARHARVVELRAYAGMSMPEIAEALGVSLRTVENDWRLVRAWMVRELS
jgi:RNA polymerase sigma-70 factor (ECF subfamily)